MRSIRPTIVMALLYGHHDSWSFEKILDHVWVCMAVQEHLSFLSFLWAVCQPTLTSCWMDTVNMAWKAAFESNRTKRMNRTRAVKSCWTFGRVNSPREWAFISLLLHWSLWWLKYFDTKWVARLLLLLTQNTVRWLVWVHNPCHLPNGQSRQLVSSSTWFRQ